MHGGAVPDAQELGATLHDVRDHERREDVVVLPVQVLQGLQKLVLALQEAGPTVSTWETLTFPPS